MDTIQSVLEKRARQDGQTREQGRSVTASVVKPGRIVHETSDGEAEVRR